MITESNMSVYGMVNKTVGIVVSLIVGSFLILGGIVAMGLICPNVLNSIANNPQAVDSATQVCSKFFQTMPNLIP